MQPISEQSEENWMIYNAAAAAAADNVTIIYSGYLVASQVKSIQLESNRIAPIAAAAVANSLHFNQLYSPSCCESSEVDST